MEQSIQTLKYFYLARKKVLSAQGQLSLLKVLYLSASLVVGSVLFVVIRGYDLRTWWDYLLAMYIVITAGFLVRQCRISINIARTLYRNEKDFEEQVALQKQTIPIVSISTEITDQQKQ